MTVQTISIPPVPVVKNGTDKPQEGRSDLALFTWTLEQYQNLYRQGIISDEDDVELIFGHIIKQAPINSPHASSIRRLIKFFRTKFPNDQYEITSELPVILPNDSQPKPDCFVAIYDEKMYEDRHPTAAEIFVVIEVSDTTLQKDRSLKMNMYGLAGIKEYWIVNLVNRQVEVHLNPNTEQGIYTSVNTYSEDTSFESPFVGEVMVSDFLPSKAA
jgi:Uma2 family endonuclease